MTGLVVGDYLVDNIAESFGALKTRRFGNVFDNGLIDIVMSALLLAVSALPRECRCRPIDRYLY